MEPTAVTWDWWLGVWEDLGIEETSRWVWRGKSWPGRGVCLCDADCEVGSERGTKYEEGSMQSDKLVC